MAPDKTYYVIAPIDGLHLDFDYRMYSAEVYGCPPDYTPYPDACSEFRQPYELLGSVPLDRYKDLSTELNIDDQTLEALNQLSNRSLRDSTCIAFQLELDQPGNTLASNNQDAQHLFRSILEKGERFLDVWRLCLFKPGEDRSIGSFGSIGNGVQCFWLGQNETPPKFLARKTSRYHLVQKPVDVLLSEFGPIYSDMTFRGLSVAAYFYPSNKDEILNRLSEALRAFRESRDIQSPEAKFRHIAAIAEDLAKKNPSERRLSGDPLRERITKVSYNGWNLYVNYNSSAINPPHLPPPQHRIMRKRHQEMGWTDEDEAKNIIKDLWDNVRNPLAHTVNTFASLHRDPIKDLTNIERVIVTMINGIYVAYEVEGLHELPPYDILLGNTNKKISRRTSQTHR